MLSSIITVLIIASIFIAFVIAWSVIELAMKVPVLPPSLAWRGLIAMAYLFAVFVVGVILFIDWVLGLIF
jgi:hypothetical protein